MPAPALPVDGAMLLGLPLLWRGAARARMRDGGKASPIPVTEALAAHAGRLAWDHKLRAYDAVQLAAALRCQTVFSQQPHPTGRTNQAGERPGPPGRGGGGPARASRGSRSTRTAPDRPPAVAAEDRSATASSDVRMTASATVRSAVATSSRVQSFSYGPRSSETNPPALTLIVLGSLIGALPRRVHRAPTHGQSRRRASRAGPRQQSPSSASPAGAATTASCSRRRATKPAEEHQPELRPGMGWGCHAVALVSSLAEEASDRRRNRPLTISDSDRRTTHTCWFDPDRATSTTSRS